MLGPLKEWKPPDNWIRLTTIDAHTAGEPLRIIIGGYPDLVGDNILARRQFATDEFDHLRQALMWEPRGHADMYGCLIVPPVTQEADFGVLFLHNEGYSSMCGHGIIAVTKVAVECGLVPSAPPATTIRIDTPAGLVTAMADVDGERVTSVRFQNVASYVVALDQAVEVPGLGTISYDLAYGGAYYAFVDAAEAGVSCRPDDIDNLIRRGREIKKAVMASHRIEHPLERDLGFLYGTIFVGRPHDPANHSRNVCIFADGQVDRSPTGTGVSARMALHYARREVSLGETVTIESILGTTFTGKVTEETTLGAYPAVIPEVGGMAYITGRHQFLIAPDDPLATGFFLR